MPNFNERYVFSSTPSSQKEIITTKEVKDGYITIKYTGSTSKSAIRECNVLLGKNLENYVETVREIIKKRKYTKIYFKKTDELNIVELDKFKLKILENVFYYKEKIIFNENYLFCIEKISLI